MRLTGNLGRLAAVLAASVLVAGCECFTQGAAGVRSYQFASPLASPQVRATSVRKAKPRKPTSVIRPKQMSAGEKLRRFCGQRHVEFQSGRLKEADAVKARNNELCRKFYQG